MCKKECGNELPVIRIPDSILDHLSLHFRSELPGSKFYLDSPRDVLDRAMDLFPEKFQNAIPEPDGRIRISLVFPYLIGCSNVVAINELTEEERKRIEIKERQGKRVRSVVTDRSFPTKECQVILSQDWQLITMFPGVMAPPLPDSPDTPSPFWDKHVFIQSL